eukprot:3313367-Prorocentrum_lima.AAC.1
MLIRCMSALVNLLGWACCILDRPYLRCPWSFVLQLSYPQVAEEDIVHPKVATVNKLLRRMLFMTVTITAL